MMMLLTYFFSIFMMIFYRFFCIFMVIFTILPILPIFFLILYIFIVIFFLIFFFFYIFLILLWFFHIFFLSLWWFFFLPKNIKDFQSIQKGWIFAPKYFWDIFGYIKLTYFWGQKYIIILALHSQNMHVKI